MEGEVGQEAQASAHSKSHKGGADTAFKWTTHRNDVTATSVPGAGVPYFATSLEGSAAARDRAGPCAAPAPARGPAATVAGPSAVTATGGFRAWNTAKTACASMSHSCTVPSVCPTATHVPAALNATHVGFRRPESPPSRRVSSTRSGGP